MPPKDDLLDKKALDEMANMLPKVKKATKRKPKKKTLDEWVSDFDDQSWMKLAQQNRTLWQIVKTTKSFSDMSWKVAVNGAFQVLSGATKRKTYVATEQEDLRLNLWNVTLGYSGISRKTTTRRSIYDHLEHIDYLSYIPVKLTPEALYAELKNTPNAMILGDELGSFFKSLKKDYMATMTDTLSDVYDCKRTMERSTVSGGRVIIREPYLRLYGGGTKSVIKQLTDEQFEQGFLARILWCLDFDLNGRQLKKIGKPNDQLKKDFARVSKQLAKIGDLVVEKLLYEDIPDEFDSFQDYCNERLLSHTERGDSITAPYYARLPFHALKLAGILYLSDLVLGEGTTHKVNVLPSDYIILGTLFMRLYEQEFLQLVYRYKSSAPSGRFDTHERKLGHVENLLRLEGGVTSRTSLLKKSSLLSPAFDPVMATLIENETIAQFKITKKKLVKHKILRNENEKYPFTSRPPNLVYLLEKFEDEADAITRWIGFQNKS